MFGYAFYNNLISNPGKTVIWFIQELFLIAFPSFPPFLFLLASLGATRFFQAFVYSSEVWILTDFLFQLVLISLPNLDTLCRWILKKIIGLKYEQKTAAVILRKSAIRSQSYYASIFFLNSAFIFEYQYSKLELFSYKIS